MRGLYEQEQCVRPSDEERQELIRETTRILYMAITRAGRHAVKKMLQIGNLYNPHTTGLIP